MMELSEAVFTRATLSIESISRGSRALPCAMPLYMMRAAVRWAMPMPSPIMTMRFFALRPVTGVAMTWKLPVAVTVELSLCTAVTVRVWTPAVALL